MQPRFQYRVRVERMRTAEGLEPLLNEMGDQGWELAGFNTTRMGYGYVLVFKRHLDRDR